MIRYRYGVINREIFERERNELTPETETEKSSFHFVKQGYYYIEENRLEKKGQFIHVAYDTLNSKLYVYRNLGKEEFTMKYNNGGTQRY
ncbi:MAG: hypothetical protein LBT09_15235 [Planctomycetaceae bacterium]|jgi:hypothetical protein|nr:hypothetical protein [Planctomycetaceae bacterium]